MEVFFFFTIGGSVPILVFIWFRTRPRPTFWSLLGHMFDTSLYFEPCFQLKFQTLGMNVFRHSVSIRTFEHIDFERFLLLFLVLLLLGSRFLRLVQESLQILVGWNEVVVCASHQMLNPC